MTVRELIELLKNFPGDAVVFTSADEGDDVHRIVDVTASQDAPDDEVYLEVLT